METSPQLAALVIAGGFVLALVFGAVAQKTDFCTMGAVSDVVNMGDWSRMRMWLLAIAVAIAGANARIEPRSRNGRVCADLRPR